jgi:cell division protein FtsZ
MMGTGEAEGEDRALMAANNAIQNPLLDEVSLRGAKAVLVNVTGGLDMTLLEVDEAANAISEQVDPEGNIIFGAAFDPSLDGRIRVSVVATGMDGASMSAIEPRPTRTISQPPALRFADPVAAQAVPELAARSVSVEAEARVEAAAPAMIFSAPEPAPVEPALFSDAASPAPEFLAPEQGDLLSASVSPAPVAATEPGPSIRPLEPALKKIIDPMVADDEDFDSIFPTSIAPPPAKAGGFRLWGSKRPARFDPPPATAASPRAGGALPAEAPGEAAVPEGEDLNIPAFLRRLAN